MYGFDVTFHVRNIRKFSLAAGRYVDNRMHTAEARKSFDGVNVLIVAREDGTFVSMNGTAKLTWTDLQQMADVTSNLENLLVQRTRNV